MNLPRIAAVLLFVLASTVASAQTADWIGTWAAAQQIPEPGNILPAAAYHDGTLRQTVHVSVGGTRLRVHLSNAFGTFPLHVLGAHVARPAGRGSSAIVAGSDQALHFGGRADVVIPPGAEYVSDPVAFPIEALSDLAVSVHTEDFPGVETGHPGSRASSFYAPGDQTAAADLRGGTRIEHWFLLSGVDVPAPPHGFSLVTLGDSITDGHGATTDGNDRWPDVLAARLQANPATRGVGVLNVGIGGNHLLTDGLGPNALARFDRDVLAQPGVRYVLLLEAINDLGALSRAEHTTPAQHDALVAALIGAYEQILARAHAHGLRVFGATVMADGGSGYYHPDAASNADRLKLNAWIRQPGHFDAVLDFDRLTADPVNPLQLRPAFDSGDHLHPNPAGYKAMGDAIPLALFR